MRLLFFIGIVLLTIFASVEMAVLPAILGEFIFVTVFSAVALSSSINSLGRRSWLLTESVPRKRLAYKTALWFGWLAFPFGWGCGMESIGPRLQSLAQLSLLTYWPYTERHNYHDWFSSPDGFPRLVDILVRDLSLFICSTILPFLVALIGFVIVRYFQRN